MKFPGIKKDHHSVNFVDGRDRIINKELEEVTETISPEDFQRQQ